MQSQRAVTLLTTLLLMLAMTLAPVIIAVTHGPAVSIAAAEDMAELVDHGHSHSDSQSGFPGHDATDHEHQQLAILPPAPLAISESLREPAQPVIVSFESASPPCPRRPPRA